MGWVGGYITLPLLKHEVMRICGSVFIGKGCRKKNPVPKKFPDRKIELGNNKQLRICAYPKKVPETKPSPKKTP